MHVVFYAEPDGDGAFRVRQLPQFDAMMRLSAALLAMEKQLGMSPLARASLVAIPGQPEQGQEGGQDRFIGAGL